MITKRTPRHLLALLAAATVVAAAGSAKAAMTYTVGLDDGTQTTTWIFNNTTTTDLGPMYTTNGSPVVTNNVSGSITLNFDTDLSTNFRAQVANSNITIEQNTDGHLVLNLQFDSPVSITASIFEGGTWSTTGNGAVSATGGEVLLEAVDPSPVETHSSSFSTVIDGTGGWTATSTTVPFTGQYTNYQLLIDNVLDASATDGTADIEKKSFIITITPGTGVGGGVPEPASLGVFGLGALALFARRRR